MDKDVWIEGWIDGGWLAEVAIAGNYVQVDTSAEAAIAGNYVQVDTSAEAAIAGNYV